MDKGWTQLPLFVIFLLFLSNAHGFKGGAHSNAHHQWGQPSDKTFSPRAVQSSVSEVPVTGILPEEVGSSLFLNRPLKRLNLLQFVKGHVSSRHESTSNAQTAPSSSALTSLPLPLNELYAGSLTSLQGSSESAATDTASVSTPDTASVSTPGESTSFPAILGTSGLSTSDQSSPSLYMSSSLETSGAESAEATLPAFLQESISYNSSSAPGATYTSQGSQVLTSEGSGQTISPQGEDSYSGLSQSQGASSQYTPDSYNVLSSSSVSSQSTNIQSSPSVSTSTQSRSGTQLTSSIFFPVQGGSSTSSLYLKPQGTLGLYAPAKYVRFPMSSHPAVYSQSKSSSGALFGGSTGFASQGISSTYSGSVQPQGTTSQFASGSLSSYPSALLSSPQGASSQSATVESSRKQFTSSYGTQSGSSKPFTLHGSTTYGGSLQPQGTTSQFASGSLSSYPGVLLSSPQGASSQSATVQSSRKQFTSSFGTQSGSSKPFLLQGSTTYGGSLQPQGTTSQFASGSLSSYPGVLLSSPQGASSQSATVQSSRKQFTSSFGTQSGSSKPFTLQGSTTYGGSLQPQGTTSQFGSGSSSSYPSVSLFSPQHPASQSATVQSSQKQFTSTVTGNSGTQEGSSVPFNLQGSTTYGGSLQPQGTTSQFASGSLSSYPGVLLSSPQGATSQSATVQSSGKQFTSSFGTQSGSSKPFLLQGSTTYGGSLQPQGTTSQFASGSLSSYPGVLLSSPQGASSQSATVQSSRKQFTSSFGTQSGSSKPFLLQGSTTYGGSLQPQGTTSQFGSGSSSSYPSVSLFSPQHPASQSATVQSSQKQFTSTVTGNSGTQSGSSVPFNLQGSTTYGGSLQPQGTTSQFASGSLSSYPGVLLSSPQGASSQSATVQSSRKQFTSSFGTQSGSSKPFLLQGSTTYGGSLQPQGTTSQFASGSLSSYPGVLLSSPQGASSQSATVQSSRKQFTSSFGTQSGSSKPFLLQGSTTYGGSLQPQGTTSQFGSGSSSSYPSVSLFSPQHPASQSATVQSSQKQFTSTVIGNSGTQSGSSVPFNLQGSTTYGGSLQPQGTTSQFASGSLSSYPGVLLSSPQGATSQSATVQSSGKQFTSSFGTQSGSSKPFLLQGSTTYGGSLQPQGTTSQFASGSSSSYPSVSLFSPQHPASQSATVQSSRKQFTSTVIGNSDQSSKAFQSYSVSQSQKSQRWQPSRGIQTSGAAASQGSSLSQSSPMQSLFPSLSSAGGSSSGDPGPFVSAQGGGSRYGGFSLHSQSPSSKYTPGSHAYAKLGSSALAVSSQSTSDKRSNGLYSADSLRTQVLTGVVERPSSQAPDYTSSNQISEHFVTMQRPTGSSLTPSLGLSAQASSGMFSGIPQTAQTLRESGSDVQLYNQPFLKPRYSVKG